MGWGGLVTVAWKKGGVLAPGTVGEAGPLHFAACRDARAGDAVYALAPQFEGDGVRDGGGSGAAPPCAADMPPRHAASARQHTDSHGDQPPAHPARLGARPGGVPRPRQAAAGALGHRTLPARGAAIR